MVTAPQGLTLEQFLELPEEKPALEYDAGMVTQKVPPQYEHSELQAQIIWCLRRGLGPDSPVRVLPELRVSYSGRSCVPDISVYRRERLPHPVRGRRVGEVRIPPDLAIEIISPDQTPRELERKCRWYVDNGALVALLVVDRDRSIRVFRPNTPVLVLRAGAIVELHEVSPGLQLAVDEVFAALDAG